MTASTRTISTSMLAVAIAVGAALTAPALAGSPTGQAAGIAISEQTADLGRQPARQRRIAVVRDMNGLPSTLMAQTDQTAAI